MICLMFFLPFEAQKMKTIPLCATNQDACLIWLRSKKGSHTVKLLCEEVERDNGSSSFGAAIKISGQALGR